MGLIRKQAGLDLKKTISKWRDSFLDDPAYSSKTKVNEDFTMDPSSYPRTIIHKLLITQDQIPDYVLFDFSNVNYVLDISVSEYMDVLDGLNKIDKHIINLTVLDIELNSTTAFRVKRVNGEWVKTHQGNL